VKNVLTAVTAAVVAICALELVGRSVGRSVGRTSISVLGGKGQIKMGGVEC
jgi:hypothetical protein